MPSNTRSSLASAPVCDAAARWPPAVVPPFRSTSGCTAGDGARPLEEGAAVADALDVREGDGRLGIVGEVLEVVGDR